MSDGIVGFQPGGRRKDQMPKLEDYRGGRTWRVMIRGKVATVRAPSHVSALVVGLTALGLDWRKYDNYAYCEVKEVT